MWKHLRHGFLDELEKIAEVSLRGLSPETVLQGSEPPPPMETPGFQKARDILSRAELNKTAARKNLPGYAVGVPQLKTLREEESKDPSIAGKATSALGHTLAGAGAGRLIGFAAHGPTAPITEAAKKSLHSKQWYGTAIGAGVGLGSYGLRKLRQHQAAKGMEKRTEMVKLSTTPGTALKASQQVAKPVMSRIKAGPSLKHQTSLIGRRFA